MSDDLNVVVKDAPHPVALFEVNSRRCVAANETAGQLCVWAEREMRFENIAHPEAFRLPGDYSHPWAWASPVPPPAVSPRAVLVLISSHADDRHDSREDHLRVVTMVQLREAQLVCYDMLESVRVQVEALVAGQNLMTQMLIDREVAALRRGQSRGDTPK